MDRGDDAGHVDQRTRQLEFGTGALDCEDLYITSSGSMRRYEIGTVASAPVPWH
jgi:hypothetical protein